MQPLYERAWEKVYGEEHPFVKIIKICLKT